jgi:hypothetical protein
MIKVTGGQTLVRHLQAGNAIDGERYKKGDSRAGIYGLWVGGRGGMVLVIFGKGSENQGGEKGNTAVLTRPIEIILPENINRLVYTIFYAS